MKSMAKKKETITDVLNTLSSAKIITSFLRDEFCPTLATKE